LISVAKLQAFHAQHKYLLMSHNQSEAKALGKLLAAASVPSIDELASAYLEQMMRALKTIATRDNHVNTLQNIQGCLKKHLDAQGRACGNISKLQARLDTAYRADNTATTSFQATPQRLYFELLLHQSAPW